MAAAALTEEPVSSPFHDDEGRIEGGKEGGTRVRAIQISSTWNQFEKREGGIDLSPPSTIVPRKV